MIKLGMVCISISNLNSAVNIYLFASEYDKGMLQKFIFIYLRKVTLKTFN